MEYTDKDMINQVEQLFTETDLASKLAGAEDEKSFNAILLQNGIVLSEEDLGIVYNKINAMKNGEELSEDSLETVSGGSILLAAAAIASGIIAGAIVWYVGKWIIDKTYECDTSAISKATKKGKNSKKRTKNV